jgi:hypothetical protein
MKKIVNSAFAKSFVQFIIVTVAALPTGSALAEPAPCDAPAFICMYGEWESVGVRAEPARIFEAMPEQKAAHYITGKPASVMPGIDFIVRQDIAGETKISGLTYAYDRAVNKSFGIITGADGSVIRGMISHESEKDIVVLFNAIDEVVWREEHVWVSPDEFHTEAVFTFEGADARVWFVTKRK